MGMHMPALTDLCLSILPQVTPENLWWSWSLSPWTALPLVVSALVYSGRIIGLRREGVRASSFRVWLFFAGWLLLAIALASPLCRMSASVAAAHMVQHVILAVAAPPLLLIGSAGLWTPAAIMKSVSTSGSSLQPGAWRFGSSAAGYTALTALYGAAIWLWHLPALYEAVLQSTAVHVVGYSALLGVSILFWAATLNLARSSPAGAGAAAFAMFITTIHTGFLGALLTLSPWPWFTSATGGSAFGLEPLEDQQIAGLIMWVPMAGIYLTATLIGLYRALDAPGRDPERALP